MGERALEFYHCDVLSRLRSEVVLPNTDRLFDGF